MPTQTQAQAYWLLLDSFHALLTLDDRLYLESLADVTDWTRGDRRARGCDLGAGAGPARRSLRVDAARR
jgi:hypothetical protein